MATTQLLDRVPVDRIRDEAREIHVGRVLLSLLVGFFWLLGWLAGKVVLGVQFCAAAVKVGWLEARGAELRPRGRPT
jgi:hypothetical protein